MSWVASMGLIFTACIAGLNSGEYRYHTDIMPSRSLGAMGGGEQWWGQALFSLSLCGASKCCLSQPFLLPFILLSPHISVRTKE